jgi:hypothetical protein
MITTQPRIPSTDSRRPTAASGRGIQTPLLFPEGFEVSGESDAESGARGGRCGRRGGRAWGHEARERRDGRRAGWALPRAQGQRGGFPGRWCGARR